MKNDMLDLFSSEELEQRFEMGWKAKAEFCSGDACNQQQNRSNKEGAENPQVEQVRNGLEGKG